MSPRHLLILGALLTAGCQTAPDETPIEVIAVEPLLGSSVTAESVTIRVISTGCTTKESFLPLTDTADGRPAVAFARRKADTCEAAPRPVDLTWTFEELDLPKGASVTVVNPTR